MLRSATLGSPLPLLPRPIPHVGLSIASFVQACSHTILVSSWGIDSCLSRLLLIPLRSHFKPQLPLPRFPYALVTNTPHLPYCSLFTFLALAYLSPTPEGNVWLPDSNYAYNDHYQPIELCFHHTHSHILPSPLFLVLVSLLSTKTNFLPSLMLIYNLPSLPSNLAIMLNCRWFLKVPASIIAPGVSV